MAPPSDDTSVINRTHAAYDFLCDTAIIVKTRGGPCQHGFMCGCKQWSNDINESNLNMQPITIIQFAVRVGA